MADLFDVNGKNIVITGGAGVLCGQMAKDLAAGGARDADERGDGARAGAARDATAGAGRGREHGAAGGRPRAVLRESLRPFIDLCISNVLAVSV